jgi:hypothetical protein
MNERKIAGDDTPIPKHERRMIYARFRATQIHSGRPDWPEEVLATWPIRHNQKTILKKIM